MNYYALVTDVGKEKIAAAVKNGTKVTITEFCVGDGGGEEVEPYEQQTELVNQVWSGDVTSYTVSDDTITATTTVPADAGKFAVREMGILDSDGDLFAVANLPETTKISGSTILNTLNLTISVKISNASAIDFDVAEGYLPLAGGTMSGTIVFGETTADNPALLIDDGKIYSAGGITWIIADSTLRLKAGTDISIVTDTELQGNMYLSGEDNDLIIKDGVLKIQFSDGDGIKIDSNTIYSGSGELYLRGETADNNLILDVNEIQTSYINSDSITLGADPTSKMQAATKQYVDNAVSSADNYIKMGDIIVEWGSITMSEHSKDALITINLENAYDSYLNVQLTVHYSNHNRTGSSFTTANIHAMLDAGMGETSQLYFVNTDYDLDNDICNGYEVVHWVLIGKAYTESTESE